MPKFSPDQKVRAKLLDPFVGRIYGQRGKDGLVFTAYRADDNVWAVTAPAEWLVRNQGQPVIQQVNERNLEAVE